MYSFYWDSTLEEAVEFAEAHVRAMAESEVSKNGGEGVVTTVKKEEKTAPLASGWGDFVFIEMILTAMAVGTPSIQTR